MLGGIVQAALKVCDGTEYFTRGSCSACGGTLSGYDTRAKRFALLRDEDGDHPVEVILHRAYCLSCGKIVHPEEPFYPGTRAGSPVIDLCRVFSETMPYGRVAARLGQLGIAVDRWSVRAYCRTPHIPPPAIAAFGLRLPVSVISLSSLTGSVHETGQICGEDILAACYHPSRAGRGR
jgi:hypothetical protein